MSTGSRSEWVRSHRALALYQLTTAIWIGAQSPLSWNGRAGTRSIWWVLGTAVEIGVAELAKSFGRFRASESLGDFRYPPLWPSQALRLQCRNGARLVPAYAYVVLTLDRMLLCPFRVLGG